MEHVKISSVSGDPILRQTPGSAGVWNDTRFHVGSDGSSGYEGPFDHWFVFDGVETTSTATCSGETIFVPWEPEAIRSYHPDFLLQFDRVLSSRSDIRHPNVTPSHPLLPWWIGTTGGHGKKTATHDYDFFATTPPPEKIPLVSCICSDKVFTEGHRKRLDFVRGLQAELGDRLLVFGSGFKEWTDKFEAITPYQYHLAIENSSAKDYWTEKVADTFLGDAYLFYWGCPNLADYFPVGSFSSLDRSDPAGAAEVITRILDHGDLPGVRAAVAESKRLVLEKYNLFAEADHLAGSLATGGPKKRVIRPESAFGLTFKRRIRNLLGGILGR
jgi:hypothetical protein